MEQAKRHFDKQGIAESDSADAAEARLLEARCAKRRDYYYHASTN
jgi:hypothetical protein